MAELQRKRSSRSAHKAHATRLMNQINGQLEEMDFSDQEQVIKLTALVENYRQQFTKIEVLDNEIIGLVDEDQVEAEQLKVLQDNDIFFMTLAKADNSLKEAKETRVNEIQNAGTSKAWIPKLPDKTSVKLPKLQLPQFDGNECCGNPFGNNSIRQ